MQTDSWLGIELRHLLALQAVAEEGSFGRAARSLGYTQSAISQQIAALERIVGQQLIDRPGGPRPVTLTGAGSLLLTHARAINARLAAAQADLDSFGNGDSGPLSIGTYQSVGARVLPTLLRDFRAEWPKVDVRLVESARRPRAARARGARRDRRQLLRVSARGRPLRVDRAHARSVRARRRHRLPAGWRGKRRRRSARSSTCPSSATARAARPSASRSVCGWPAASRTSSSAPTTTAPCRRSSPPASASRSSHG